MNKLILVLAAVASFVVIGAHDAQAFGKKRAKILKTKGNVVLVTLDGVRWQEVFNGVDRGLGPEQQPAEIFSNLWNGYIHQGVILGNKDKGAEMTVANSHNISLPAYHSIAAGMTTKCASNECGRVPVETMQERIRRELGLTKYQVATIASWDQIPLSVESKKGATFTNASVTDLDDGTKDPIFEKINQEQRADKTHFHSARHDKYTMAHALHYLEKHKPRFLFVSLNDSDEYAHGGDYPGYVRTLRSYDAFIAQLIEKLKSLGQYGRETTLIVTTDHGRGTGAMWQHHGFFTPDAKFIWLYGSSPRMGAQGISPSTRYTHLDIRPTVEAAVGLTPKTCTQSEALAGNCGRVITEILK